MAVTMDRWIERAVRMNGGRRAQSLAVPRTSWMATVRAVASAAALALLVLVAASSLGKAQSTRGYTRTGQPLIRTPLDTIGLSRTERPAPSLDTMKVDASALAASVLEMTDSVARAIPLTPVYRSRTDSIAGVRSRLAADRDTNLRILISLAERRLYAMIGPDTLLKAPVAVSTDETLSYAGRSWRFITPRGVRTIIDKKEEPVWIPPEWHYAEVAQEHGLKLAVMKPGKTVLSNGDWLEVRNGEVGVVERSSGEFALLPTDEEVIFDSTLFVPPVGTVNRRIAGELGRHMLDTGNGFLLHGTPHKASIGTAATHGCIRLRDEDIKWLYEMVPVGTRVYIY
jgi:lipoprotein-anchoring transpeptidase ErfK/SrfK